MTTRFEPAENERGSALLMSLVLIFVMTVLGLALFDLGVVESRLVYTSQADARAFEIAQAGVERALRKLQDTYNEDLSWASGIWLYRQSELRHRVIQRRVQAGPGADPRHSLPGKRRHLGRGLAQEDLQGPDLRPLHRHAELPWRVLADA